MRVEFRVKCPSQQQRCRLALTTFSFSCDEARSSRLVVASMQSFGQGQLPPDTKDLLSLHSFQEHLHLTCWNVGQTVSDELQKWFWCLSMVSWDFSLPRSEKGFQNAHRLILVITVLPCLALSSFGVPGILELTVRCRAVWNCGVQHTIELCCTVSTY
jgi:hypothetical protein